MLTENIWIALVLWGIVYLCDYLLTIYGARLYRRYAQEHLVFEGSYELNPAFQKDVDALAPLSLRFVTAWIISLAVILFVWGVSFNLLGYPGPFNFLFGALFLLEAPVQIRHIRNIALFRMIRNPGYIHGKIEYSRRLSLRLSAVEIFGFAVLYLFCWLATGSSFFLGGGFGCLIVTLRQWLQARKTLLKTPGS